MLELSIPMPALSLNHSHISLKRGGRIKTKETRIYEENFSQHLLVYAQEIKEFLKSFIPEEMGICADYRFYFPADQYFTKKGKLNLSGLPDTDNLIKITQDLIFSQLMNDAYVIELSASKVPTDKDPYIEVELETIPLPQKDFLW